MTRIESKKRQSGATFLGMLTIIAILGFALYAGIRLIPLYKEYMDVSRAMTQISKEMGPTASSSEIRTSLQRRWDIEDIKSLGPKDIEIGKQGNSTTLRASYRAEAPFVANISLVVDFDKTVVLGGAGP